jgi:hypothetical protein
MRMIAATVLLLLSLISTTPAQEQPQQACTPIAAVLAQIGNLHPIKAVVPLEPEQAQRVIAWFNSQPPESKLDFNLAIIVKHTEGPFGLLLGKDGNVCVAFLVPDEMVPDLIKAIMGVEAMRAPIIRVQDHAGHPPQDMDLHNKFYSTWYVPNLGRPRVSSCCNQMDCAPAETKRVNGHWYGRRALDSDWLLIPDAVIESNQDDPRESPDGESHICAYGGRVLCAVLGAGL